MKYRSILEEKDWFEDLQYPKAMTMKRIVVPVDFSDVSRNAARYAAAMANDIPEAEILLYHVYDGRSAGSDGSLLADESDAQQVISENALNNLRSEILPMTEAVVGILAEAGSLSANLEKLVSRNGLDLVIMGIHHSNAFEQVIVGSSTLQVIRKDSFPVLIIPPDARYARIRTALFASDFMDVDKTTPVAALRSLLHLFRPALHVIHIDESQQARPGEDFLKEKKAMDELLQGFNPEYHFIPTEDFLQGISNFARDNQADLIITVPHHHSFLADLFTKTHTEKLAYQAQVPVLAVHD